MLNKRITIFTGHFGSGKTEISINYALSQANEKGEERENKLSLVDLDFVNPYFRSREVKASLNQAGIRVVASAEDYFNTDVPAFSPVIGGVLADKESRVIVDLGGDDIGARAIGRFRSRIPDEDYQMCFVINPFRPFTSNAVEIRDLISKIETASRLKVTSIISNPNLGMETKAENIVSGHEIVADIARILHLPLEFLTVETSFSEHPLIKKLPIHVMKITRMMLVPWEQQ